VSAATTADTTEPVPTPPCEEVEGATLVDGDGAAVEAAAPVLPNIVFNDAANTAGVPVESPAQSLLELDFVLDSSGDAAVVDATRSPFTFSVGWDGDAGDFDVYLTDAAGNELGSGTSFNPLDGPGEVVGPVTVRHCSVVTLRIENYAGIPQTALDVSVTRGKPRR